jgi:hypothetical protein
MSGLASTILLLLIAIILFGSRRLALLASAAGILYLTQGEQIIIFGFNLYAFRLILIFGLLRVLTRHEFKFSQINKIDKIYIFLYLYTTFVFLLRSNDGISYQIGVAVDAIIAYFFFRGLIVNMDDFKWFLSRFVFLLIPFFAIVLIERFTLVNLFKFVGANAVIDNFRDGIPRCTGSFRHAILLGSFGAAFLPLYIGYFLSKTNNNAALLGSSICLGIIWLSNSGGPVASAMTGFIGWSFWFLRKKMRLVRKIIFFTIIVIAIFMNAPIWYLPAKIGSFTGGSGWHRSYLIDMAIQNFSEWWQFGIAIEKTESWFPYVIHTGGADITNEFLSFGISAGIVSVIIFITLLVKCFKTIGSCLSHRQWENNCSSDKYLIWGLGVTLLVHISNWFGVGYFDQIKYVWYIHIAAISMLSIPKMTRVNDNV